MDLHPIRPVEFDRSNLTRHKLLVKLGVNSLRLHLYASLIKLSIIPVDLHPIWGGGQILSPPVEFDRALITGQIGCKFTEITFVCLPVHSMATWSNLVVIISMDLHPIRPVEFDRALITGQIGCKFSEITFVCLPGRIGYHLSEFTPNLTSNLCPVELLGILHCACWEFLTTFTENSLLGILHCFTWDYIVCLPVNFHPIWPVINADLGVNSLR